MRTAAALALLAAAPAWGAPSLDPTLPAVQQIWSQWYSVRDVAQTRDGYVWLATNVGLVRFDGQRFVTFTSGGKADDISALAADENALWLGTRDGHLARFANGQFAALARDVGSGGTVGIRVLQKDGSGVLIGSDAGAVRWEAGRVERLADATGKLDRVMAMARDRTGNLWIGTAAGLFRVRVKDGDGNVENVRPGWTIATLGIDPTGDLRVVTTSPRVGVQRLTDGNDAGFIPLDTRPSGEIGMLVGADGTVWVIGTGNLFRIRDERVDVVALPAAGGRHALLDREGSIWLTGNSGVVLRLAVPFVTNLGATEGLGTPPTFSVIATPAGEVWAGLLDGIARIVPGPPTRFLADPSFTRCSRTFAAEAGSLWIGSCSGWLMRHDGKTFTRRSEPVLDKRRVRLLARDPAGTLWVATVDNGVLRSVGGGPFQSEPLMEGHGEIRSMLPDRQGGMWFGTTPGQLFRLADGRLRTYGRAEGLPAGTVNSLYQDARGAIWVGTLGAGLYRVKGDRVLPVGRTAGLAFDSVHAMIEDTHGQMWLTTDAGLFRIITADLDAYFAGRQQSVRAFRYGLADGFATERFTDGFFPVAALGADGLLYLATTLGVSVVRLPAPGQAPPAPTLLIESVSVSGRTQAVGTAGEIALPRGSGDMVVTFTAPSFGAAHRLRFEHRLEGHDEGWIDDGPKREARYSDLSPGQYQFRVRMWLDDAAWGGTEAHVALAISGPRRAAWIVAATAGALLLLALSAQRLRLLRVRRRFDAVLNERNRIARDLHDSLAQGFAGLGYQLDRLSRHMSEAPPKAREALEAVRATMRAARLQARQSIWNLRTQALEGRPLPEALADTAQQAQLSSTAAVQLTVTGDPYALPTTVEAQLLRIAQESTTNALVHGLASRVTLVLRYDPLHVELAIEDDGKGFDPEKPPEGEAGHFGLQGMRERAAEIGAELRLDSAPGRGARVEVRMPRTRK